VLQFLDMKNNKYIAFWEWFKKNSEALYDFENGPESLFVDLINKIHSVNHELTFAFGPIKDGKREFVISSGGIKAIFPDVIALYKEAPDLPKWTITAFRPRIGTEAEVAIEDVTLSTKDVYFLYQEEGGKIGLTLFIKKELSEVVMQILFIFLDNALGEFDVATKIGTINFKTFEADKEDLLPFTKLPEIVDAHFKEEEQLKN
jgi:hypothetical protein